MVMQPRMYIIVSAPNSSRHALLQLPCNTDHGIRSGASGRLRRSLGRQESRPSSGEVERSALNSWEQLERIKSRTASQD